MFLTIVRREAKEGLTSLAFLSALALLGVLAPLSAYIQARYYEGAISDQALRQQMRQERQSVVSEVLARPLPPLLPFFNGVFDSFPDEVGLHLEQVFKSETSEDLRPLDWLFPRVDLSLIVGVLMTLMAVLLSHDAVTGEKEQGMLKLVLAGPVARSSLLMAKLAAVTLLMAIILAYTMLLYAAVVIIFSGGAFKLSPHNAAGLAAYAAVSLLLLILFAALGIAASTLSKQSYSSLCISMGVWVLTVLIWPSLAPYVASSLRPMELKQLGRSRLLAKEIELVRMELEEHRRAAAELEAARVGVAASWEKHMEILRRWTARKNEEVGRILAEGERQARAQEGFVVISPYGAFSQILGSVCGTGTGDYQAFLKAAERYNNEEFSPAALNAHARQKTWIKNASPAGRLDLPPFEVPALSLQQRIKNASPLIALLALEVALLVAAALFMFSRYDVR
jgi:ABC-type transport system involved in multi-copper enzyme maturation permease subunit